MARLKRSHQRESKKVKSVGLSGEVNANLSWPVFCFRFLQPGHDVDDLLEPDRRQLLKRLRLLSQLEWKQIEQASRHGLGKENIAQNSISKPLPPVVTQDIKLWALRFSGLKPMIGFRAGGVFHLLWIDHNFSVYPHSGG